MANVFPTGKMNQPRRPTSFFPAADELDVLGEEQSAFDEASAAAAETVSRDKVVGSDGTINWWEALAPLLTAGLGAALGGSKGALLGATAGAGYLQGRVETDERFRKQRQMDAALTQQAEDRKVRLAVDAAKTLYEKNPKAATSVLLKVFERAGVSVSSEEVEGLMSGYVDREQQKDLLAQIGKLQGDGATPETILQARDLQAKNYKLLFGEDPTDETLERIESDTKTRLSRLKMSDAESAKVLEKYDLEIEDRKIQKQLNEMKLRGDVSVSDQIKLLADAGQYDQAAALADGMDMPELAAGYRKKALEPRKLPPALEAKGKLLQAINRRGEDLLGKINATKPDGSLTDEAATIQSWMGPAAGRGAEAYAKYLGGKTLTGEPLPKEVSYTISALRDLTDQWLRERTGAQANESEIASARDEIMGSMLNDPVTLGARLQAVMDFNKIKLDEYYSVPGAGADVSIQEAKEDFYKTTSGSGEEPVEGAEGGDVTFDPETGEWRTEQSQESSRGFFNKATGKWEVR